MSNTRRECCMQSRMKIFLEIIIITFFLESLQQFVAIFLIYLLQFCLLDWFFNFHSSNGEGTGRWWQCLYGFMVVKDLWVCKHLHNLRRKIHICSLNLSSHIILVNFYTRNKFNKKKSQEICYKNLLHLLVELWRILADGCTVIGWLLLSSVAAPFITWPFAR